MKGLATSRVGEKGAYRPRQDAVRTPLVAVDPSSAMLSTSDIVYSDLHQSAPRRLAPQVPSPACASSLKLLCPGVSFTGRNSTMLAARAISCALEGIRSKGVGRGRLRRRLARSWQVRLAHRIDSYALICKALY